MQAITIEKPLKFRIFSLDLLKGLVMIIMALDHTRDFFHADAFLHDPLDLASTSPGLFFTRWITHFCAPLFVFLAGAAAYLQGMRKSKAELTGFLIKRGLWLIFVEVVIISFAWTFDISYHVFILQVIWAIGISMCLLGLLIRLPYRLILILGIIIVVGHNVFDFVPSSAHGFWWDLLRNGSFASYPFGDGRMLIIIYPFVPWLGVMMLGYCFGKVFEPSFGTEKRKQFLLRAGIGTILLFVLLRATNTYGDPHPWMTQDKSLFTILSFLNLHKYPPSLLYLCMTLGPALLFLMLFEKTDNKITRIISVYGRVPFFYYVIHFYLLHILGMILFVTRGHNLAEQTPPIYGIPFHFLVAGEGYSLTMVYVIWASVVVALYPLCKRFAAYKKKYNHGWLSYL